MLYEIFKYELHYRAKSPETYLFFIVLLTLSIFGVDVIFQGVELGLVKKNAPLVLAKTMCAYTGVFMILASIIMGMPILRDDYHEITPLIYTAPMHKSDLLGGRFLGSFLVLILIFMSIPLGMMLGEFLPWRLDTEMGPFNVLSYIQGYMILVVPFLFFGGSIFYVSGALSKNLLVVYTQGIIIFVLFVLTKSITDPYIQAILDPFSLTTLTFVSEEWSSIDKNRLLIPLNGSLLVNKLFWVLVGLVTLIVGYRRFSFSARNKTSKRIDITDEPITSQDISPVNIPFAASRYGLSAAIYKWITMSIFYFKSLTKESSFRAIVICAIIVIVINSINLGTIYGVDSYPTTFLVLAELQEMSMYFFVAILLFYTSELYWSEQKENINFIFDASSGSTIGLITSKLTGIIGVYIVLFIALIGSGMIFQLTQGYHHFDTHVYFTGFFIEILPKLILFSVSAFFFQALTHNKFLGILFNLVFIIGTLALHVLQPEQILLNYGSGGLMPYSEMNEYGHSAWPYLWIQLYWGLIAIIIIIITSLLSVRGVPTSLLRRITIAPYKITKGQVKIFSLTVTPLLMVTGYIYHNSFVVNEVWSIERQIDYRANYEKTLKQYEYMTQPQLVRSDLHVELYPDRRSYIIDGAYTLVNHEADELNEIHIQKQINSTVHLRKIEFSRPVSIDSQYHQYDYTIYTLDVPLVPGDSIVMSFQQESVPKGWDVKDMMTSVNENGTFIRNNELPTLGYFKKYELSDSTERAQHGLKTRMTKASINDPYELTLARSGSDGHGVTTNVIIGTSEDQTAICSGQLTNSWKERNRNYFQYQNKEPIINFYAIQSGIYDSNKDTWQRPGDSLDRSVDLEIYYHPRHNYNIDRMMSAIKASLTYYEDYFSPYQYDQLRIAEYPRYEDVAQSFPSHIAFSESLGFLLDIDDEVDVDMTFFITAHEVAHQWWGMQVQAANVQGQNFVLETLSQYAALMVLKRHFPKDKIDLFLDHQEEKYELGQKKATRSEVPLHLVENQDYIYYNKGAIIMYQLQEMIGEEQVNSALSALIADWNSTNGPIRIQSKRYPTSHDVITYILDHAHVDDQEAVRNLLYQ